MPDGRLTLLWSATASSPASGSSVDARRDYRPENELVLHMLTPRKRKSYQFRAILEHLGLWLVRSRPPPKIHHPPVCMHGTDRSAAPSIPDDVSQIPPHADHFHGDPQYSWDDVHRSITHRKKRRAGEVCPKSASKYLSDR